MTITGGIDPDLFPF